MKVQVFVVSTCLCKDCGGTLYTELKRETPLEIIVKCPNEYCPNYQKRIRVPLEIVRGDAYFASEWEEGASPFNPKGGKNG